MTYPPEQQHPTYQPPQPAGSNVTDYIGPALGILGALMVIAGSLMPWGTVRSVFGSVSINGTDGDGVLTLGAGVAVAAVAALTGLVEQRWLWITQVVLTVGVGALGLLELYNVTSESRDASNGLVHVSVGSGLYVLLLGAGLAVVASVLHIGFKVSR